MAADMTNDSNQPLDSAGIPADFWSAAEDLDELELPRLAISAPTLERLVPSPFPRSGFPLIGFLATVYDHVSAFARARNHLDEQKN